jgi:hypothetical protein
VSDRKSLRRFIVAKIFTRKGVTELPSKTSFLLENLLFIVVLLVGAALVFVILRHVN